MKIRITRKTTVGDLADILNGMDQQFGDDTASITLYGDLSGHMSVHDTVYKLDKIKYIEVEIPDNV